MAGTRGGSGHDTAPAPTASAGAVARVAVVGVSTSPTCGVRAHAELLAGGLEQRGLECSWHWLGREGSSLRAARAELGTWTAGLPGELAAQRPDAVLVHYSVFSYSFRGVPLFSGSVMSALRRTGLPVVTVMHEFAYPWLYGGWRGLLWSVSQRAALPALVRTSDALIVTAPERREWLGSRIWLRRRPVAFAPVYSNLPPPHEPPAGARTGTRVGLFGYAYQGAAQTLVLDALARLRAEDRGVELMLLGAPGGESGSGLAWREEAARRGFEGALAFSGRLPAQELSDALARCDLLLFVDLAGASSRKGSLAGSLASGRPVVAIDGPQAWDELVAGEALRVAAPTAPALAAAVGELLSDRAAADALGARGRAFAEGRMGLEATVDATVELLGRVVPERAAARS
jgi:hypothetical protein